MATATASTIHVIVNPAAGKEEPILPVLSRVFRDEAVRWTCHVTQGPDDAPRFAAEAVRAGAAVVAVYGGDGTVAAVAGALRGGAVPLAILPGGTGNVVARELGVPLELEAAARLAVRGRAQARPVDGLLVGERLYLLRVGVGADARVVGEASAEDKARIGWLAYLGAAIEQLVDGEVADFTLEVDGLRASTSALFCSVANIGRIGRSGVPLASGASPFDGELDLVVVRSGDVRAMTAFGASLLAPPPEERPDAPGWRERLATESIVRVRCREVSIDAAPPQQVHGDGDVFGQTPVTCRVEPGAVRIVLPEAS